MYPDVLAETYDGTILRIELELCAQNFISHEHDPQICDLIISFVKPFSVEKILGVPVISIFNAKGFSHGNATYDPESLKLTNYFQKLVVTFNQSLSEFLAHNLTKIKSELGRPIGNRKDFSASPSEAKKGKPIEGELPIKAEIPEGWMKAKTRLTDLKFTSIPHRQIMAHRVWGNFHPEPTTITMIPISFALRDKCIAEYYQKIRK